MAGKNFRCSECGMEFETREKMDEHNKRQHPGMQGQTGGGWERSGQQSGGGGGREQGAGRDMSGTERGKQQQGTGPEQGGSQRGGQQNPGRSGSERDRTPDR